MRTTLTLDQDVALGIDRLRQRESRSLREVVNRVLREGLKRLEIRSEPQQQVPFRTQTVSLGRCLVGDLTSVSEALATAEGEDFK